jgi:hypothetical protein
MIKKESLTPFISVLLAEDKSTIEPKSVHQEIVNQISRDSGLVTSDIQIFSFYHSNESVGFYSYYKVDKSPSWLKKGLDDEGEILNSENHLILSMKFGQYWAFYASEDGRKQFVRDIFLENILLQNNIFPLSISKLQALFVNQENVKVLWMRDIRGKYSHSPSSKTISGTDLADKLNPLLDQSYMMSASRTDVEIQEKKLSLGVSPFKSIIWSKNCDSWDKFEEEIILILDYINNNNDNTEHPISVLAYPISDISILKNAYAFSLIDKDSLDPAHNQYKFLTAIQNNYTFEIDSGDTYQFHTPSALPFHLLVKHQSVHCVTYKVTPSIKNYEIKYKAEPIYVNKKEEEREFKKIFKYSDFIKCWYDSGHALVGGMAFKTELRDVIFSNFAWGNFELSKGKNYNLLKEKPTNRNEVVDLNLIGTQSSLFCWVKNHWSGDWTHNKEGEDDEFITTGQPSGLLICDDGAGEIADFIHINLYNGTLYVSFIHVKSACNESIGRDISVGAHDIVVNQAVKNMMRCDRNKFVDLLNERQENTANKQCWKNGSKITYQEFSKELNTLMKENRVKQNRVIIVQPHTLKSKFKAKADSVRGKQLNTLLVAAQNAITSTGADFFVVGCLDQ